jgi:hypothetical protein
LQIAIPGIDSAQHLKTNNKLTFHHSRESSRKSRRNRNQSTP